MGKNAHKIFINTLLLTAASLVMKGVGLVFQIYLADRIGASSLGVYSLIMSVYTMFVTIGSGGIRFAVTRLTAAAAAEGGSVRGTVGAALVYALMFASASALCLFFSADFIGERWIGAEGCASALKILSVSIPFISLTAVFGGYFTGVERIVRSVAVDIGEQLSRIFVTIALFSVITEDRLPYICAVLAIAALFGEIVNGTVHTVLYLIDVRRFPRLPSKGGFSRKILTTALPIAVSAYLRTGLSSLGHILIPRGLRAAGSGFDSAFATYGAIHAMAFPVLLFPSALLTALAELIIPRLTAAQSEGNQKGINYMTSRVIKIGLMFSALTAAVMFFSGGALGEAIYKSSEVGLYMKYFAPLIPVMYCDMVTDGCLKGLGQHMKAMYINIAEATLNVTLLYFLIPRCAILGYGISIYVCECFNFALSFGRLLRVAKVSVSPADFAKIALSAILAAGGVGAVSLGPATAVILTAVAYAPLLYIFGAFPKSDVLWLRGIIRRGT